MESGGFDSSGKWGSRISWRAYLRSRLPLGDGEVRLQSRASKFQTNHGLNGDRFLCAVGCMGLRGIQRAVRLEKIARENDNLTVDYEVLSSSADTRVNCRRKQGSA
jgi:hypothetical protein